ncbi:hypothetical protein AB1Y20_022713 [Prymnesium parvum]|uniref:Uncharacterized protein n=1 Tax=Prymnesium parvum TaxID=97485 RepID=A0AB34JGN0_PRYPA
MRPRGVLLVLLARLPAATHAGECRNWCRGGEFNGVCDDALCTDCDWCEALPAAPLEEQRDAPLICLVWGSGTDGRYAYSYCSNTPLRAAPWCSAFAAPTQSPLNPALLAMAVPSNRRCCAFGKLTNFADCPTETPPFPTSPSPPHPPPPPPSPPPPPPPPPPLPLPPTPHPPPTLPLPSPPRPSPIASAPDDGAHRGLARPKGAARGKKAAKGAARGGTPRGEAAGGGRGGGGGEGGGEAVVPAGEGEGSEGRERTAATA